MAQALVMPERPIDWEVGAGWEPLCEALGVPIPDEPFPRTNTTAEFLQRTKRGSP
jgi:hypothetical protein